MQVLEGCFKASLNADMMRCCIGGLEFDGRTEISPLIPGEIQQAATDVVQQGIKSIVLSGVFSPINPAHELAAAAILKDHLGPDGSPTLLVCACVIIPV